MEVSRRKKRLRRYCGHCDNELCHTQYFDHRKRFFRDGVWEKKSKTPGSNSVSIESLPLSSHEPTTSRSCVPSVPNLTKVKEVDASEVHAKDFYQTHSENLPESEVEEMHSGTDSSDNDQSLHLFLIGLSGLSRQLTAFSADVKQQFAAVNEQFAAVNSRLLCIEERLTVLGLKTQAEDANTKKRRRVHNPNIAEAVRRLHNSETNCRRYNPEQGLNSPHNEAVTSYLLGAVSTSPKFPDTDKETILAACKTYYETIRRNHRYQQPDLALQAETAKNLARSRSRRKRLLEARRSVLQGEDEAAIWESATIDLMSEEEDGVIEGVSGWIVRPPSFRSRELSKLCAALQARLEANPKYLATHHRRLQLGQDSVDADSSSTEL